MSITYHRLRRFVADHGDVAVLDAHQTPKFLRNGGLGIWDLALHAIQFQWQEKWYPRTEFELILDKRLEFSPVLEFNPDVIREQKKAS